MFSRFQPRLWYPSNEEYIEQFNTEFRQIDRVNLSINLCMLYDISIEIYES